MRIESSATNFSITNIQLIQIEMVRDSNGFADFRCLTSVMEVAIFEFRESHFVSPSVTSDFTTLRQEQEA
jgi:hypothetical protein